MLSSGIMNKIPQNYLVSSADWEVSVDHTNPYSAAIDGVACALNRFGKSTLISTVVMVSKDKSKPQINFNDSDFFASSDIFRDLGCEKTSKALEEFCNAS